MNKAEAVIHRFCPIFLRRRLGLRSRTALPHIPKITPKTIRPKLGTAGYCTPGYPTSGYRTCGNSLVAVGSGASFCAARIYLRNQNA